jgi:hypothetical protein
MAKTTNVPPKSFPVPWGKDIKSPTLRREVADYLGISNDTVREIYNVTNYLMVRHLLKGDSVSPLPGLRIETEFLPEHYAKAGFTWNGIKQGEEIIVRGRYNYSFKLTQKLHRRLRPEQILPSDAPSFVKDGDRAIEKIKNYGKRPSSVE